MNTKLFIKESLKKQLNEVINKKIISGILIQCTKTDRVFLLFRNDEIPVWALVTGCAEVGESPITALKREISEELSINPSIIEIKKVRVEHFPGRNREFHYFKGFTNSEFNAILDHENLKYGWFSKNNLPSPLFEGVAQKISEI